MTKVILMSIKPKPLKDILDGKKTKELRKSIPKDFKGWVYLYCVKPKVRYRVGNLGFFSDELYKTPKGEIKYGTSVELMAYDDYDKNNFLSGKIVARFWFSTLWFDVTDYYPYCPLDYPEPSPTFEDDDCVLTFECDDGYWVNGVDLDKICMTYEEMLNYGNGKDLYAWNIRSLEIFDEPMELSDVYKYDTTYDNSFGWAFEDINPYIPLTRAPKSWQYAWTRK